MNDDSKYWKLRYAAVILLLLLQVVLYYWFTQYWS